MAGKTILSIGLMKAAKLMLPLKGVTIMLEQRNTILVCIDIQGNLAQAMYEKEKLFQNLQKLITGIRVFDLPIVWTEQHPLKLGSTIQEIAGLMPAHSRPISKMSFSCCGNDAFVETLKESKRSDVLLSGMETHICVYQTAVDLVRMGYRVHVVTDCVASRTAQNNAIGIEKIRDAGAVMTGTETVLFELLKTADSPLMKDIVKIVK